MALYDDRLRQKIAEANDPEGFRDLVMTAAGVRPEAQAFVKVHSSYTIGAVDPVTGKPLGQGWSPPLLPDRSFDLSSFARGTVNMRYWQAEGTLHECFHVWAHWWVRQRPEAILDAICLPAMYARMGPSKPMPISDLDPADIAVWGQPDINLDLYAAQIELNKLSNFKDFIRGYVFGIGNWPGMYFDTATQTKADLDNLVRDQHLVDWAELLAGLMSWCMGQYRSGLRRLPPSMWWLFQEFCSGEIQATPYYMGGPA